MRSTILVSACLLLSACGQAGPLYLPETAPADDTVTTDPTIEPDRNDERDKAKQPGGGDKDD